MVFCWGEGGSPKQKRMVKEAFFFAMKELMPRKKNLDVQFFLKWRLEADGYHCFIDRGEHEVELKRTMNDEDLITAVFHEMVHVRQYERNVPTDFDLPYLERPTEIEAYELQESMLEKYKYSHGSV